MDFFALFAETNDTFCVYTNMKYDDRLLRIKPERFVMHQEDLAIAKVENLAKKSACTKSWIYRAVLVALVKKYPNELPEDVLVERPKKFDVPFRQTTICFFGDRARWFSLCRIWMVELGPLIRFAWGLYEAGELELELDSSNSVKELKKSNRGKKSIRRIQDKRYRYLYQNDNTKYAREDFWPKNSFGNLWLMKLGLQNRIHPLILPDDFILL